MLLLSFAIIVVYFETQQIRLFDNRMIYMNSRMQISWVVKSFVRTAEIYIYIFHVIAFIILLTTIIFNFNDRYYRLMFIVFCSVYNYLNISMLRSCSIVHKINNNWSAAISKSSNYERELLLAKLTDGIQAIMSREVLIIAIYIGLLLVHNAIIYKITNGDTYRSIL